MKKTAGPEVSKPVKAIAGTLIATCLIMFGFTCLSVGYGCGYRTRMNETSDREATAEAQLAMEQARKERAQAEAAETSISAAAWSVEMDLNHEKPGCNAHHAGR